jgi:zinc transport system ATP-binding protein
MTPAVEIRNLYFRYGDVPVLEDVNLVINPGRFVCFAGPNGGGKTTLFKVVLGLLQPQAGSVRVLGRSPAEARTAIGYVPQHFAFDPSFPMRVVDVVRMGLLGGQRLTRAQQRERVEDVLNAVGLAHLSGIWFNKLSGGQRQRILIARGLATAPEILLLDEPTSNVDAGAEEEILSVLQRLHGKLTVLLVTHSASVASRFLETIVCVNRRVHVHPATQHVDDQLMRHISGYEALPPQCEEAIHA